jgi:hypothetical protein
MKRTLASIALGIVVGGLMAWAMMPQSPLHDLIAYNYVLSGIWNAIHLPAIGIILTKQALGLPPHGDEGFIFFPIAVFSQWVVIGSLAGLIWNWIHRRRSRAQPATAPYSEPAARSPQR